jgi:hypothetical protein
MALKDRGGSGLTSPNSPNNSGSGGLTVEDVFSTYVYTGNGSTQTIENGIALGDFGVGTSTEFDGVDDYLSRSTDLVGNTDSKTFTFSCWVYRTQVGAVKLYSCGSSAPDPLSFSIDFQVSSNNFQITLKNTSDTTILSVQTPSPIPTNKFTHILVSIDISDSGKRHIYFDDTVQAANWYTYSNDIIDFTRSTQAISAISTNFGNKFKGRLSNLFLDYS